MPVDKSLLSGSVSTLLLQLLEQGDMYGFQMIETLARRSDQTFSMKAGSLYPALRKLEEKGAVRSYLRESKLGASRKYYSITPEGRKLLAKKKQEWRLFSKAVNQVLEGGEACAHS